jgi:wyosine [tRNA(Phe)-imidazoG37] synthetase (radical SAM superfamily)
MSAAPILEFEDKRITEGPVVYGPFGRGLVVNMLGSRHKVCSFDCPYCDLGRTTLRLNRLKIDAGLPSVDEFNTLLMSDLQKIHAQGPAIDALFVSGQGEPTIHPDFPELAKATVQARDLWQPGKSTVLFTNGSTLDNRKIAEAANLFDERIVKVDCGTERAFKNVNAPLSRTNLAKILSGIQKLKDVTVQSLFFTGSETNTQPTEIEEWIEVIAILKPKAVHIQGMNRTPAKDGLVACDEDTLYGIASRLERKTQIRATVINSDR